MLSAEDEVFMTPVQTPICLLDSKEAFGGLSDSERRYTHHLEVGSWAGSLVCLIQTSPESPALFSLREDLPRIFFSVEICFPEVSSIENCFLLLWNENYFLTFYSDCTAVCSSHDL